MAGGSGEEHRHVYQWSKGREHDREEYCSQTRLHARQDCNARCNVSDSSSRTPKTLAKAVAIWARVER